MFPLLPHQVVTQNGSVLQKGRLGIDRDTITYSRLHKHLTNIFRLGDRYGICMTTQNMCLQVCIEHKHGVWPINITIEISFVIINLLFPN